MLIMKDSLIRRASAPLALVLMLGLTGCYTQLAVVETVEQQPTRVEIEEQPDGKVVERYYFEEDPYPYRRYFSTFYDPIYDYGWHDPFYPRGYSSWSLSFGWGWNDPFYYSSPWSYRPYGYRTPFGYNYGYGYPSYGFVSGWAYGPGYTPYLPLYGGGIGYGAYPQNPGTYAPRGNTSGRYPTGGVTRGGSRGMAGASGSVGSPAYVNPGTPLVLTPNTVMAETGNVFTPTRRSTRDDRSGSNDDPRNVSRIGGAAATSAAGGTTSIRTPTGRSTDTGVRTTVTRPSTSSGTTGRSGTVRTRSGSPSSTTPSTGSTVRTPSSTRSSGGRSYTPSRSSGSTPAVRSTPRSSTTRSSGSSSSSSRSSSSSSSSGSSSRSGSRN